MKTFRNIKTGETVEVDENNKLEYDKYKMNKAYTEIIDNTTYGEGQVNLGLNQIPEVPAGDTSGLPPFDPAVMAQADVTATPVAGQATPPPVVPGQANNPYAQYISKPEETPTPTIKTPQDTNAELKAVATGQTPIEAVAQPKESIPPSPFNDKGGVNPPPSAPQPEPPKTVSNTIPPNPFDPPFAPNSPMPYSPPPEAPVGIDTSMFPKYGEEDEPVQSSGSNEPGGYSYVPSDALKGALGSGDGSDIKNLNATRRTSENEFKPEDENATRLAKEEATNEGKLGVGDIEKRLSEDDANRYTRAKELAAARGAAFDKYTQGLNANERRSFISTIINSLGKILVGGYDLATGPKVANASQYYKGIPEFDKKAADEQAKTVYDVKTKQLEANEADIQNAEKTWMDNKNALEGLRNRVNGDVFKMAMEVMSSTKKLIESGVDTSYITKGVLDLLTNERDYNLQMQKLRDANAYNIAILDNMNKNVRAKIEADAIAKKQTAEQKQNEKSTVTKKPNEEMLKQQSDDAMLSDSTLAANGLNTILSNNTRNEVAAADAAWKNYRNSPSPKTRAEYVARLNALANAYSSSVNLQSASGYFTDPKMPQSAVSVKVGKNLKTIINMMKYDTEGNDHPLFLNGPNGLKDTSSFLTAEQNKVLSGNESIYMPVATTRSCEHETEEKKGSVGSWKESMPGAAAPTPSEATPNPTPAPEPTKFDDKGYPVINPPDFNKLPGTAAPATQSTPRVGATPPFGGAPAKPAATPKAAPVSNDVAKKKAKLQELQNKAKAKQPLTPEEKALAKKLMTELGIK